MNSQQRRVLTDARTLIASRPTIAHGCFITTSQSLVRIINNEDTLDPDACLCTVGAIMVAAEEYRVDKFIGPILDWLDVTSETEIYSWNDRQTKEDVLRMFDALLA